MAVHVLGQNRRDGRGPRVLEERLDDVDLQKVLEHDDDLSGRERVAVEIGEEVVVGLHAHPPENMGVKCADEGRDRFGQSHRAALPLGPQHELFSRVCHGRGRRVETGSGR